MCFVCDGSDCMIVDLFMVCFVELFMFSLFNVILIYFVVKDIFVVLVLSGLIVVIGFCFRLVFIVLYILSNWWFFVFGVIGGYFLLNLMVVDVFGKFCVISVCILCCIWVSCFWEIVWILFVMIVCFVIILFLLKVVLLLFVWLWVILVFFIIWLGLNVSNCLFFNLL